jgi:hypothetical protein
MQGVNIGAAVGGQRDHIDALVLIPAQADDIEFVVPFRREMNHAILFACLDQLPLIIVKGRSASRSATL